MVIKPKAWDYKDFAMLTTLNVRFWNQKPRSAEQHSNKDSRISPWVTQICVTFHVSMNVLHRWFYKGKKNLELC